MRKRSGQVYSRESSATLQLTVSLLYPSINELIDKVYEKSYNLHQLDRTEFMKNSVWSFFDNMESVSKFIKIIMDECRVNNAMFRERDFVCIKDMITNMIFCL